MSNTLRKVRDMYWQRNAPPVKIRGKLWHLRCWLKGHRRGPYKSPWLPNNRIPVMVKQIYLNRDDE